MVSGVVSGMAGYFPMVSEESMIATRLCSSMAGEFSMVLGCSRVTSFRHFVEHLVCSTPGTVATGSGRRVWVAGMGSDFGLGLVGLGLLLWVRFILF